MARPLDAVELAMVVNGRERGSRRIPNRRAVRVVSAIILAGTLALLLRGEFLLTLLNPGQCAYLRETGRPCVGCGGTRAYGLAARGHWRAAARMNLLGAFAGLAVWLVTAGSAASLTTGRACFLKICAVFVAVLAPLALAGGMMIWWREWSQYIL